MTKEKLLIHQDKTEAEKEISKLESHIPILQKLHEVFDGLDLGKMDEKIALSLLSDKGTTAGEMFLNTIAADCYSTGNRNKHFVNQQIKAQGETVDNFKAEVSSLLDQIGKYYDFSKFSYSESVGYYVPEEYKKEIIEKHKIYLADKKDIEYYEAVKAVCNTINTLNKLTIERTGYNHIEVTPGIFNVGGGMRCRFDGEVKMLENILNTTSETTQPDPNKIIKLLRKSNT